jgi:2-dehydro-3-deoxyphosphogluconate aldolase/(4S)-4-hydroxy-2-oxoglutarate aldolase
VPVLPGVVNPDGVARGLALALEALKFFPAGAFGGTAMLDAFAGPFGSAKFVPTGGIDAGNLANYARRTNVLAVGGSWMVPADRVEAQDWPAVERLCREAVAALHGFQFAHLGLHGADEGAARGQAGQLERLFHLAPRESASSIFAGERIELVKSGASAAPGHIAMRCNQVDRALAHLAEQGIGARPETAKGEPGRLKAIYLDLEIGGFPVHLMQA